MTGLWGIQGRDYDQYRPVMDLSAQCRDKSEVCDQIVKFSEQLLIYGQLSMGGTPQVKEAYKGKMKNVAEQAMQYEEARNWYLKQFKPEVK